MLKLINLKLTETSQISETFIWHQWLKT